MVPMVRRMIWRDWSRCAITVAGVGFSVMLMLFLCGVYEGVTRGATGYVSGSRADIWVCQNTTTNLLRSSSYWDARLLTRMGVLGGIQSATSIVRVLTTATIRHNPVTLFVFGYDPQSTLGAPPALIRGTATIERHEIVLDRAFASKHHLTIGDSLVIQNTWFRIAGISNHTNATVAQFAFTAIEDARALLGMPECASFGLLTIDGTRAPDEIIAEIEGTFPSLSAYSRQTFIRNNLRELSTGVLPVLAAICFFGALIAIMVVTLMLYSSVLEQREDYALLKALGADDGYIAALMVKQAITVALAGFCVGLGADLALTPLLTVLVPELSPTFTGPSALGILGITLCVGVAGSWAPIHTLTRVFPAEVFRA